VSAPRWTVEPRTTCYAVREGDVEVAVLWDRADADLAAAAPELRDALYAIAITADGVRMPTECMDAALTALRNAGARP